MADEHAASATSSADYFDAETTAPRARKFVKLTNYSMSGVLPEQGSWHFERKQRILKAHPEIGKLYGTNPWSAAVLLFSFTALTWLSLAMARAVSGSDVVAETPAAWLRFVVVAYTAGALLSWYCEMMAHEGTHGLVFKSRPLNKLFACVALLPVLLGPFGNYWAIEHMHHHKVVIDKMNRYGTQQTGPVRKALGALLFFPIMNVLFCLTSLAVFVRVLVTSALFAVGIGKQPIPTTFRLKPYDSFPQAVNSWHILNIVLAIVYNAGLFYLSGGSLAPTLFQYLSGAFANGLHPLGMRQVQEHYLQRAGQPTYSVYSPFNRMLCNTGLHVEHHDFPQVPWNRLPQITKIAPESYSALYSYNSYLEIFGVFLFTRGVSVMTLVEN